MNVIKWFVESGHDMEVRDFLGANPFHNACKYNWKTEVVEYLIEQNPSIITTQDTNGKFGFSHAVEKAHYDVALFLLQNGSPWAKNDLKYSIMRKAQRWIQDLKNSAKLLDDFLIKVPDTIL